MSSLGDELAGALDDFGFLDAAPATLGRSLADEFGQNEGGGEFGFHAQPSLPATPTRKGSAVSGTAQNLSPFPLHLSPSPGRSVRRKRSSISSYHTAHLSFSSGIHDVDEAVQQDVLPLEGELDVDIGPSPQMDGVDHHGFPHFGAASPLDGVQDGQGMYQRHETVVGGKDPMVEIEEYITYSRALLDKIKKADGDGLAPGVSTQITKGQIARGSLEDLLQRHLAKLLSRDQVREDQVMALNSMEQKMDEMGFKPSTTSSLRSSSAIPPSPVRFQASSEEANEGEDIGWIGVMHSNPTTPVPRSSIPSSMDPIVEDVSVDEVADVDPFAADDSFSSNTPADDLHPSFGPRLPALARQLATSSLPLDLAHYQESLHSALSQHTALSRQIRGIRAAVESFREREAAEIAAQEGIEAWDRARMEKGLKGEESTEVLLRKLVEDSQINMDKYSKRMDEIMRALPPRMAA